MWYQSGSSSLRFLILLLWIARRHIRTREELKQRKPGVDFNGDNNFQTKILA
ncbi:hypothetical protein HanPI659440_Chr14g0541861 [Helianthus annuus]|nr:hypothetical protein HanPI659440_Chr14g0541861 [Helianthus annuus]